MNPAMWISKTGVQAQDAKLQAIANNLANVNTVGFKRDRVVFEDLHYQVDAQPGAQSADNTVSNGVQLGNGTRLVGTQKVFTNGNIQTTSQQLDVAISEQVVGTIAVATFPDEGALAQISDTSWAANSTSGLPLYGIPGTGLAGKLNTGSLEGSNVDITSELVGLMTSQRNYQANSKVITTENQMMQALMQAL